MAIYFNSRPYRHSRPYRYFRPYRHSREGGNPWLHWDILGQAGMDPRLRGDDG